MKFGGWVRLGPKTNPLDFGSDRDADPDVVTLYSDFGCSALARKVFVVESSSCHQCVPCREADHIVCVRHVSGY